MKKIYYAATLLFMAFCLSSCDSYFDIDLKENVTPEQAFSSVRGVETGVNGAYWSLGTYRFLGRNVVALGDIASDNAQASSSSGHFVSIWTYAIDDSNGDLTEIWQFGYKVLDGTTATINGATALISKGGLSNSDIKKLYSYQAQCYALRALASHKLVQVFGLPYGTDNNPHGGIVVIDKEPIETFSKVSRSSVAETYTQILKDIDAARSLFDKAGFSEDQFYMTPAGLYALEARVQLDMGEYAKASEAANNAIIERDSPDVSNATYLSMWSSITISDEDIFTIAKSEQDNLSANSLNTLYGSYSARMNMDFLGIFHAKDIRRGLLTTDSKGLRPLKFAGIASSAATNNIPVFRKSEMYLIVAEAEARLGNISEAQEALFYTAKRDLDITDASMLPSTQSDLLTFISQERRRELFQEGFRWYDVRRTGEKISVFSGNFNDFNARAFVYPIPSAEINSGFGVQQNEGWYNNLPK